MIYHIARVKGGVEKDKNGEYHAADIMHAQKVISLKTEHRKALQELEEEDSKAEAIFKFYEATKG